MNCTYCGRVRENLWHQLPSSDPGVHAFVEPAAPAPQGDDDAARAGEVRFVVNSLSDKWFQAAPSLMDSFRGIAAEAYAAGRAAGTREERKACEKLVRDRADVAQIITAENTGRERTALHRAADAIARRGKQP